MSMSMNEAIKQLPPSAKLVFKVLEQKGPLTQQQITEESMLPNRTVRYALEQLDDIELLYEDIYFPDARQQLYELNNDERVS
jgi:Fic family protein